MPRAIVMGGSRGIGRAIAESLRSMDADVFAASRRDVDTSDLSSVRAFLKDYPATDVLVLNTGGPDPKPFREVTEEEWMRYHNQLFLGFCMILREMHVRDGGYIFLISSSLIKEPGPGIVVSSAYRAAFSEVFKVLSREYASREVSCINIAPGLIATDRTNELLKKVPEFQRSLPMGRLGRPGEIGDFVKAIVQNNIKYLSGVTINFDGADSRHIF